MVTLDLDGVICAPPFGRNFGISRTFLDPDAEPRPATLPPRWVAAPLDHLRFDFRRPLPHLHEALTSLRELRTVVLLTGRRSWPHHWLRRHRLTEYFDRIVINETPRRSAHFKLRAIEELGAAEHLDDDGRTAQLLAQRSAARSFLRDWPRNRGPEYAPGLTRVADLREFVERLRAEA